MMPRKNNMNDDAEGLHTDLITSECPSKRQLPVTAQLSQQGNNRESVQRPSSLSGR